MNKRRIHVETMNIRIRGGSAAQGRALSQGLAQEIMRGLADSTANAVGAKGIGELSAGKIVADGSQRVAGMKRQIAGRVVDELRKKI